MFTFQIFKNESGAATWILCLTVSDITLGDNSLFTQMESTDFLLFMPFEEGHAEFARIFGVGECEIEVSIFKFHRHLGVRDMGLIWKY